MHIKAKGFENIKDWGREMRVKRELNRDWRRGACPEAFCIIALLGWRLVYARGVY